MKRRSFFGKLFGAIAASCVTPLVAKTGTPLLGKGYIFAPYIPIIRTKCFEISASELINMQPMTEESESYYLNMTPFALIAGDRLKATKSIPSRPMLRDVAVPKGGEMTYLGPSKNPNFPHRVSATRPHGGSYVELVLASDSFEHYPIRLGKECHE